MRLQMILFKPFSICEIEISELKMWKFDLIPKEDISPEKKNKRETIFLKKTKNRQKSKSHQIMQEYEKKHAK